MRSHPLVDLASPEFRDNPYPFYSRLRDQAPVCRVRLPDRRQAWLVTRYDDVLGVLKDARFVKNRINAQTADQRRKQPWMPAFARPLLQNMLDLDPPDHTRLRMLVQKAFTPRIVEDMRERIAGLTQELLTPLRRAGRMDLVREYARPLPTTIIAEMLGVPRRDRQRFHRWSAAIVSADSSRFAMVKALPGLIAFLRFIRKLVRRRKAEPGQDLLSSLVRAEERGDALSEDELLAMVFLLLVAGFETTVNLIGNGTLALLQNPDQMRRLQENPEVIKTAVEELLRFDGPLRTATERYASVDVELSGAKIPKGDLVFAALGSANRDERQFDDPDRLDLGREPNRHLAFGNGIHYCLGAPLARLEAQIAINALFGSTPDLRLNAALPSLRWRKGLVIRGLEGLPVKIGRFR